MTVGGGDDAHIDAQGFIAADALHLPPAKYAAAWPGTRRCFRQSHRETGAAIRQLKTSFTLAHRAGKRAFLMAEQFALQQRVRQRRAVKFDEGGGSARRIVMDGIGDQLFPVPLSPRTSTVVSQRET
jgi:hypothetical protein